MLHHMVGTFSPLSRDTIQDCCSSQEGGGGRDNTTDLSHEGLSTSPYPGLLYIFLLLTWFSVITPTASPTITQIIINPSITLVKHIQQQMLFSVLDLNYAFIIVLPMHSFCLVVQGVLVAYLLQQASAPWWTHYYVSFDHHYSSDTVFVI